MVVQSVSLVALALVGLAGCSQAKSTMDFKCIEKHCLKQTLKATTDPVFWESATCQSGCNKVYDTDTTPEKLVYQNCTTTCALTYDSPAMDNFLDCSLTNECLTFPEIPGSCPFPKVDPNLSLADLAGEWWQHRGKNALWDCYNCQHIHSMFLVDDADWCAQTNSPVTGPVQAPCWNYSYSYDLYVKDKHTESGYNTKYFGQSWQLPAAIPAGQQIDIYYSYMGSLHNESWFLLDARKDKYVLLVDCSYMNTWIDVGSIVWVRPGYELTADDDASIAAVYQERLGWDYSQFCYDVHGPENCDGPERDHSVPMKNRRPTPIRPPFPVFTPETLAAIEGLVRL